MLKAFLSALAASALVVGSGLAPAFAAGQVYAQYDDDDDDDQAPPQEYSYSGCDPDRVAVGTGLGMIVGGIIGNQFGRGGGRTAATIGGVVLGGIAGNAIARDGCRDERADAYYYNRAYYDAFDEPTYGHRYDWRNPHSGNYGYITPTSDFDDGYRYGYDDGDCREFQQTIYIDGQSYEGRGIACRNPDGSWKIVNH